MPRQGNSNICPPPFSKIKVTLTFKMCVLNATERIIEKSDDPDIFETVGEVLMKLPANTLASDSEAKSMFET